MVPSPNGPKSQWLQVQMASEVPMVTISAMSANMRSASDVRSADVSTYDKPPLQLPTIVATSLLPLQLPLQLPAEVSIITCLIYIAYAIIATAGINHCIIYHLS